MRVEERTWVYRTELNGQGEVIIVTAKDPDEARTFAMAEARKRGLKDVQLHLQNM